jgi:hypothetical protein
MDFNTTIDIILKDLKDVREIIEDLKNYPGLPQLQVELAKSKCRSAEEVIALLKTIKPPAPETVATRELTDTKEPIIIKEPEPVKSETLIEFTDEETEVPEELPVIEKPVIKRVEKTETAEKKSTSAIIADRFTGPSGTISDKFGSEKKGEDLASLIKRHKHVENLADAIGLSDKFLFVREIFKGNQPDYEQAIEKLNRAENLQDARAVIMSYTGENEESEVVQQLLEILKRKLPSDG